MKEGSRKGDLNIAFLVFYPTVCRGWWVYQSNVKNNSDKNNSNLKHNLQFYSVHLQDIALHMSAPSLILINYVALSLINLFTNVNLKDF